jgi:hypothetical protein
LAAATIEIWASPGIRIPLSCTYSGKNCRFKMAIVKFCGFGTGTADAATG